MTAATEIWSNSPIETVAIGRSLGAVLAPGDVVGLIGQLGAGKTLLTKGIAEGLGVADSREVNSPTFVLVNEYRGRHRVLHLDAYRMSGEAELADLGFDEMCGGEAVVVVEWADRVGGAMPAAALLIELRPTGDQERQLTFRHGDDARWGRLAVLGPGP